MKQHDLVVIGAGPGGYVAAIRAAQLGMNVACIEKEPALGGTCLRVGCIPSKAMLEYSELFARAGSQFAQLGIEIPNPSLNLAKMLAQKDRVVKTLTQGIAGLLKKNKITRYEGHARLDGKGRVIVEGSEEESIECERVLIATGSQPSSLPGLEWDGERIVTSTDALAFQQVPEHLVVVGAGYIGLEMGTVWRRLGAKVTVLEYLDRILPGTDSELAAEAHKLFHKQGLDFRLEARVTGVETSQEDCRVLVDGSEPIDCDRVLVAVGRTPNTERLGLETVDVKTDERGFIAVDERFATSAEGVYAIGDVIGGAMLAHKAEEEGIACVEWMASGYGHVSYETIPSVVYTQPELAAVGATEDQLQSQEIPYRKGSFPFMANGRARAIGHIEGRVKVLAHAETDRLLGVHILGPHAGDLIAEAAVAMQFGASSEDLARCCHAHPTLSEAVKEACLAIANGAPIHL